MPERCRACWAHWATAAALADMAKGLLGNLFKK
jgi:hypothetical protein